MILIAVAVTAVTSLIVNAAVAYHAVRSSAKLKAVVAEIDKVSAQAGAEAKTIAARIRSVL